MKAEAELSRKELKGFLRELSEQVDSGRIKVHIPGKSQGKISIAPRQPTDIEFIHDDESNTLEMKIKFKERR